MRPPGHPSSPRRKALREVLVYPPPRLYLDIPYPPPPCPPPRKRVYEVNVRAISSRSLFDRRRPGEPSATQKHLAWLRIKAIPNPVQAVLSYKEKTLPPPRKQKTHSPPIENHPSNSTQDPSKSVRWGDVQEVVYDSDSAPNKLREPRLDTALEGLSLQDNVETPPENEPENGS